MIKSLISRAVLALLLVFFTFYHSFSQDKSTKIDELVQKYYELGQINGSVLVSEGGKIIYNKGVGYADFENKVENKPDTKFRLASVTKQFTATLIMQLVEKGKIRLDGKLNDYLTYYRKDNGEKITIHHILTHTSGIPNYTDDPIFMREYVNKKAEVKDFVIKYCSGALQFDPGSKWDYSNSGYFILGAVIEQITGKTYETVLKENILEPLEMTSSGYDHSELTYENKAIGYTNSFEGIQPARFIDMTVPYSAGSMYSTVEDMFKWDQGLYTDKILSNESKEKMYTPFLNNYGYGWGIKEIQAGNIKKKIYTHTGGIFGFNTIITRFPDDKNLIVILNNVDGSGGSTNDLAEGITHILYGLNPTQPKKNLTRILAKSIQEKGIDEAIKEFKSAKDNKAEYRLSENDMNNLGYYLLQSNKKLEAIEVFKMNVDAFPESFNVYDSLGEAYAAAGDKENAIINYKKSIEINPDNEGGKKMLKQLEGK